MPDLDTPTVRDVATEQPQPTTDTTPLEPGAKPKLLLADASELETFGRPSPEAQAKSDEEGKKLAEAVQKMTAQAIVPQAQSEVPDWYPVEMIPKADSAGQPFRFPRGRDVMFLRLRADWTDTPADGDRYLICWAISYGDQQFAVRRAQGDANRVTDEMTKQMIRAIDGRPADWTAVTRYSPDLLWQQIGQRCRNLLVRIYLQLNTLSSAETKDFFANCVAVVRTG